MTTENVTNTQENNEVVEEKATQQEETKKNDSVKEEKKTSPKNEARYTDADLDRIIDKKFAKWKQEEAQRIEEAKKLASMNATEKAEHERDFEKKRADEAEAKLTRYGLTDEARGMLSKEGITLSENLLDVLVGTDAETTKTNVDNFITLFRENVDNEVKKRIAGTTPKSGSTSQITKDDILGVKDPRERKKLIAQNISMFKK